MQGKLMTNYKYEILHLNAGKKTDPITNYRAIPIYQTTSFVLNSREHVSNLFMLKELGNLPSGFFLRGE